MYRGQLLLLLLALGLFGHRPGFTPPLRGKARLFLDTADVSAYDELLPLGMFSGVTTNPAILKKDNVKCTVDSLHQLAGQAFKHTDEFMCQSWGKDASELYDTGMKLAGLDKEKIVVKVPATVEGIKAAKRLLEEGVRVCLTACYSAKQALIATGLGVEYVAPYLGRMNDNRKDGFDQCYKMHEIVGGIGGKTRVLVASLRDVVNMQVLAQKGLDTFTFSPRVARQLLEEPLTEKAAEEFEEAVKG
ncbi:unnamed protein product [Durusdinium trenchii]|uniref:Transaldolase n=2 Tax=Durusdinium trenchii TaxID=1381693 RepID=A0ABP0QGJ6_9DINO